MQVEREKLIREVEESYDKGKKDIIKSMLDNNLYYDVISKVTGESIDYIKEIESK